MCALVEGHLCRTRQKRPTFYYIIPDTTRPDFGTGSGINSRCDVINGPPEGRLPRGPFVNLTPAPRSIVRSFVSLVHCWPLPYSIHTPTRCVRTSNKCLLHGASFSAGVRCGTRSHNGARTIPARAEHTKTCQIRYISFS